MNQAIKKVGNYRLIKRIGSGATSEVFEGRREGQLQKYAIKMIHLKDLKEEQKNMISKEVSIIKSIQHPNVVTLYDTLETNNNYYLIFEFCEKGDLQRYLKDYYGPLIPEQTVQQIIYCIADALRLIHSKGIVHRDIKLANILLKKDCTIKVADFGFAKSMGGSDSMLKTYCGTPITMAPQILQGNYYDKKCDVWSMGVILFQLVYGKLPFSITEGYNKFVENVINENIKIPSQPQMSDTFKKLIFSAMEKNPQNRVSIEQFINNPWVQQGSNQKNIPTKNTQTVSELLRQVSNQYRIDNKDHEQDLKSNGILQQIIGFRIANIIVEEINNLTLFYQQNLSQIQKAIPCELYDLLKYLDYKFVQHLTTSIIEIVKESNQSEIKLKDIRGVKVIKALQNSEPMEMKSGLILLEYLKKVSMQQISLQQKKQRYELIIKIIELIRRFTFKISIIFTPHFYQDLSLNHIIQAIKNPKEEIKHHPSANFITISMQSKDKNIKVKQCRDSIIGSCHKRIDQIQKQINGY